LKQSSPAPQQNQPTSTTAPSTGNVFDQYEADLAKKSQENKPAPTPGQINVDDPNDGFFTRQAKKVAAVGAGVGEDVLDAASLGAKVLHLPHQTIDERSQELADDNADNPGLRTTGRIAGVVVPALASGVPQAALRVAGAGATGLTEGALQELEAHGLKGADILGAAIRKGVKGEVLYQLGHRLGIPSHAVDLALAVIGSAL
jgi:hypothetical protein